VDGRLGEGLARRVVSGSGSIGTDRPGRRTLVPSCPTMSHFARREPGGFRGRIPEHKSFNYRYLHSTTSVKTRSQERDIFGGGETRAGTPEGRRGRMVEQRNFALLGILETEGAGPFASLHPRRCCGPLGLGDGLAVCRRGRRGRYGQVVGFLWGLALDQVVAVVYVGSLSIVR
jgi:hypothetical protein